MEDYPGAIIPADQTIPPSGKKRKIILIIILLSVSLAILISGVYLFYLREKAKTTTIRTESVPGIEQTIESHPKLFLAEIEYNPQTGLVIQRRADVLQGDPPPIFAERPPQDQNRIIYKVEVVSEENIVLQSGWYSDYKQKVQTKENTLRFQVVAGYSPGAIVRLYFSEDKLIWTGKIE